MTEADPTGPGKDIRELGGPSELAAELSCGRGRWLYSTLAALSVAAIVWIWFGGRFEIHYPIHLSGSAARYAVGVVAALWIILAVVNWRNWIRRKRTSRAR